METGPVLETCLAKSLDDQAAGLRRIFAAETVRVIALVGGKSTTISTALAIALAGQGKKVLLVDEQMFAGKSHPLMGKPFSADINDVLKGKKSLREIVRNIAEISLLPGVADGMAEDTGAGRVGLLDAFHELAIGFDFVIVNASDTQYRGVGFSLAASEVMVLCDESDEGIMSAYRQMKVLTQLGGDRRFMMMFHGEGGAFAKRLFHKLTQVCKKYLKLMPEFAGVLPKDQLLAVQMLEMVALDMMHWPVPGEGDTSRFEVFMCRLLTAKGNSNLAAA